MKSLTRTVLLVLVVVVHTAAVSVNVERADIGLTPREKISYDGLGRRSSAEVMAPRDVRLVRRLGRWSYNESGTLNHAGYSCD